MANAPTPQTLQQQAHSEVQQQVDDETAPIQGDITQAQGGMATGLAGIGKMFSDLMPYAQNAAKFVGDYYNSALAREQGIYEQAQGRLSMIRGQRAAEAQHMAQQTGGPVNVESFLAPLNTSMVELPNAQQNTLFHSNMLAQGGVQEAEAWAGRVFPMIRVEQETQLRNEFQAKIDAYQKEIDRIKASATGREKTRLEELQEKEREYKLEQARLALDRLKADRDWRVSQQNQKVTLAQLRNQTAEVQGYYEGRYRGKDGKIHTWRKPTWAAQQDATKNNQTQQQINEQHRAAVTSEGFTQAQIDQGKVNATRAYQLNQAKWNLEKAQYVQKLIQDATTPGTQTSTYTQTVLAATPVQAARMTSAQKAKLTPISLTAAQAAAQTGDSNAKAGVYYFSKSTEKVPTTTQTINDPTQLYKYLLSNGVSKTDALKAIRAKYQLSNKWGPGQTYDPADKMSMDAINKMDFATARKKAAEMGWQKGKTPATLYTLQTWLYHYFGYPISDKIHPPTDVRVHPPVKTKITGPSTHTYQGHPVPASVKWDPKLGLWWDQNTGKTWLKGHRPDKNGNPG